ncbi:MAG: hypothetical protein H6587_10005 [Flavobacteriales bacterium]|nr:hypothetical protein [Flavobacteriales bacterium]
MERKIKLIWEFYGPDAEHTAKHHQEHLGEFAEKENLIEGICGAEYVTEMKWLAYLICVESEMIKVRDALKPLRGELFEE